MPGQISYVDGVEFPASQAASANVNTLDDYQEGTWVPGVGSLTVVGAFSSSGEYVKIGRQVTVRGNVAGATSVAAAAAAYIGNLPFAPSAISMGIGTNAADSVSIAVQAYTDSRIYICEGFLATTSFDFTVTYFV
jgi:hypothetical protein